MGEKGGLLVCGDPNTVLRIFIETIQNDFNVFFIGDRNTEQYQTIKKSNRINTHLFNGTLNKISLTRHLPHKMKNTIKMILLSIRLCKEKNINCIIIHGNSVVTNGLLLLTVKWLLPKVVLIYFPYDIYVYSYPKGVRNRKWGRCVWFFDKISYEKCDKIITKGYEDELKYLALLYNLYTKPHFVFNQLIETEDITKKKRHRLNIDKIDLVYIGIITQEIIVVFKYLMNKKNINLHIYTSGQGQVDLHNKNLVVHEYIKQHKELIKIISKYDFGIHLNLFHSNHLQDEFASAMKIYDYLSAGLPIIVNNRLKGIASIVEKNNFGIVIQNDEVDRIMDYIKRIDYISLLKSVEKNRNKFFVDGKKIIKFIEACEV